jgi:methylated-DNA-protein-cysteine methyltransferase-like protein
VSSSFFDEVYRIVADIPSGRVVTYGQIAAYLGSPRAARTVGWALSSLPVGMDVPWHRVINSQGRISGSPEGYRAHEQRALLEEEGITFEENGRIDLDAYGWTFPR